MIVLVGCGARKRIRAVRAADMYTGQYFRACWKAAQVVAPGRVCILSAKYGLLEPGTVIEPYELTLGQSGAVTAARVAAQAAALGVDKEPVTALCGSRYVALARQVWPAVEAPLTGLGIGWQLHALARIAAR